VAKVLAPKVVFSGEEVVCLPFRMVFKTFQRVWGGVVRECEEGEGSGNRDCGGSFVDGIICVGFVVCS
jgi:hypothetical protein